MKKKWLFEPLIAAGVGLAALAVWVGSYTLQREASGIEAAGASASSGGPWYEPILGASWLLLVSVWAALAILLNRFVPADTVPKRLGMSFIAAVIVIAPFVAYTAVGLWTSDGWRGLGAAWLLFQLCLPAFAVGLHCVALGVIGLTSSWTRKEEALARDRFGTSPSS